MEKEGKIIGYLESRRLIWVFPPTSALLFDGESRFATSLRLSLYKSFIHNIASAWRAALANSTSDQSKAQQQLQENFALKEELGFDEMFFDNTCLEADIHFLVDWVLLCDDARKLMQSTDTICRYALRTGMPP